MKFEKIQVGDCLHNEDQFLRVLEKYTSYINCLVIDRYDIYKTDYYPDEVGVFEKVTKEYFNKTLNTVCCYYTGGDYESELKYE